MEKECVVHFSFPKIVFILEFLLCRVPLVVGSQMKGCQYDGIKTMFFLGVRRYYNTHQTRWIVVTLTFSLLHK